MRTPLGPAIALALLALPSIALADPRPLEFGDRVRLQLAGDKVPSFVGTVGSMSESLLTIQTQGAKDVAVPIAWSSLSGIHRSEGTRSHALFGGLAGFFTGFVIAAVTASNDHSLYSLDDDIDRALLLMGGGLVVGTAAGVSMRSERWHRISDPHLELAHR
ncbi:MAG TPA: hypothetical protein VJY35_03945 [Candidatus Eisenbacteria bacterium]|nr:hypothetical protein [Candidatus Eisenbacteria bacterium]